MGMDIESIVERVMSGRLLGNGQVLQQLWSGYGAIIRFKLTGAVAESVVVKCIDPPKAVNHPRGWNTDHSHQRKLRSYEVEAQWYRQFAQTCPVKCRVPKCYGIEETDGAIILLLEDLDASGYSERHEFVKETHLKNCLSWLANFHATFLNQRGEGLWPVGTYWHLATRPDELAVLHKQDSELANAACIIDQKLQSSAYQTFVHGDAKLANFCFNPNEQSVAAVDFQYVGGGCGMKDIAYFFGSCLDADACEAYTPTLLEFYFKELRSALELACKNVDLDALEADWRALYPLAWVDFQRFLKGWSPNHWKINDYSEQLVRKVLDSFH